VPRRRSTRVRMGLGLLSKRVVSTGSDRVRMPPDGCRGPAALANNAGNLRDGPHLAVELVPTLPGSTNFVLVGRAIHSSHDRSPADTHGQCRGGCHLRRSSSDQVAIILDLALQAGGRLVAGLDRLAVPGRPMRSLVAGGDRKRRTASATGRTADPEQESANLSCAMIPTLD
jgi:hypothetical protein